jgi:hypothetical protein
MAEHSAETNDNNHTPGRIDMISTSTHRAWTGRMAMAITILIYCGSALAQDKHIDVSVVPSGGAFKLVFNNSECADSPSEKGCVFADRGTQPVISWELTGNLAGQWNFTRLQMSPDGIHWGEAGYPLNDCTVDDFNLTEADRVSGAASSAQVVANGQRVQIRDNNRNVCETYYRLYAAPVNGGGEIDSDPRIRNGGN